MTLRNQPLQFYPFPPQVVLERGDAVDLHLHALNVAEAVALGYLVGPLVIRQILSGGAGPLPALKPHQR